MQVQVAQVDFIIVPNFIISTKQLPRAIRFGHIWILKLSKIVGENHEFCHLIGVHTLLMRTSKKNRRPTNESEDLAFLVSKLQLGQNEMPSEDCLIMGR